MIEKERGKGKRRGRGRRRRTRTEYEYVDLGITSARLCKPQRAILTVNHRRDIPRARTATTDMGSLAAMGKLQIPSSESCSLASQRHASGGA